MSLLERPRVRSFSIDYGPNIEEEITRLGREIARHPEIFRAYPKRWLAIKMLEQDLAGEEGAIERYKTRIEQAESLKEFALAHQLRNILSMEQEHAMDLQQALGK